jgi:hypothetical protein
MIRATTEEGNYRQVNFDKQNLLRSAGGRREQVMLQRVLTGYDVVYSGILEVDRYKILDGKGRKKR